MLNPINLFSVSSFFTAVTFFPLAFLLLSKGTKAVKYFGLHCLAVALWGAGAFVLGISTSPEFSANAFRFIFCPVLFISVFSAHCFLLMSNNKYTKYILPPIYLQAIFFCIISIRGEMTEQFQIISNSHYWFKGSPYYLYAFLIWITIVGITHTILLWHYIISHPDKKRQLIFLVIAIPVGFGGGATNFFYGIGIDVYPYGNCLVPFYSLLVGYAILQHQLFDITYVLRKGLAYFLLIITICGLYFMTIMLCRPIIESLVGSQTIFSGLLAALILGLIYAPMRLRIEQFIDATIFQGYRKEVERQKQLIEEELVRSEKFKMVSTITRGIIYEMRNPLTSIKTRGLLIPEKTQDKEFLLKSCDVIERQVDRINELLSGLSKFSTSSQIDRTKVDAEDMIQGILKILNHRVNEKSLVVQTSFNHPKDLDLALDAEQFQQAIYNIVINAIDAMEDNGTLTISTSIKKEFDSEKSDKPKKINFFTISIEDTGHGIPEDNLKHIFDPFYSPGERKTGLGLSIAHRIITEHGGNITVESELNKGSTFTVWLPIDTNKENKNAA
ncbi:MAG: hypothetical protein KC684_02655 [Candidatus Omnitrophica bacterium]|nr:hypothetical protein [Candidatus Omnitrophota bacterium]